MRPTIKAALTLAAMMSMAPALAGLAAGPAAAKPYPPPSIHLLCSAAPTDGTVEGTVCVLHSGVTTAPNAYSATIAVSKAGAAGAIVTFALTAGSLPPGLTMPAQSGSGTVITGNPTKAGTFNFTVKATDGNLTSTMAYQITVTVQGPPDQLLCDSADNGGLLISGVCVLPDAVAGVPYQGHLVTSHKAGGALSVVVGSLPPGLSLSATFGPSGAIIGGTPGQPGIEGGSSFTVQGTGDQGQPLYQAYSIAVDQNLPLTIVLPASGSTFYPGTVGQALALDFFLSGGACPYTWALAAGKLPPGMTLQNSSARAARRRQPAGRNTDHGRHLHLHHAAHRLRRSAGHPAIHPPHPALSAGPAPRVMGASGEPIPRLAARKSGHGRPWGSRHAAGCQPAPSSATDRCMARGEADAARVNSLPGVLRPRHVRRRPGCSARRRP